MPLSATYCAVCTRANSMDLFPESLSQRRRSSMSLTKSGTGTAPLTPVHLDFVLFTLFERYCKENHMKETVLLIKFIV